MPKETRFVELMARGIWVMSDDRYEDDWRDLPCGIKGTFVLAAQREGASSYIIDRVAKKLAYEEYGVSWSNLRDPVNFGIWLSTRTTVEKVAHLLFSGEARGNG